MKKNLVLTLLLVLLFIIKINGKESSQLILLQDAKLAKCLDGTAPGYYYTKGYGEGEQKFVLYMEGGFYCPGQTEEEILESCYQRSFTNEGSSSTWNQTYSDNGVNSPKEEYNPLFYNWNRFYIKYCDGTFYQSSKEPIVYKNTTLYFRGSDNVKEIIDDISKRFGLLKSSIVVLGGESAGGQASYAWSQYLRNYLPKTIKMLATPDCGFHVEFNNPDLQHKNAIWVDFVTDGNRQIIQPQGCPYLYDDLNIYKCFLQQYIVNQINVPVFFISSLYDQFFITKYLQIDCINGNHALVGCSDSDMTRIEGVRQQLYDAFNYIRTIKQDWGVWAVSCVLHVFSLKKSYNNEVYQVPEDSQITPALALMEFVEAVEQGKPLNDFYFIDQVAYPSNTRCNGLQQTNES